MPLTTTQLAALKVDASIAATAALKVSTDIKALVADSSPPVFTIITKALPAGTVATLLGTFALAATGGAAPYAWTATGLPAGLVLSTAGILSGTPVTAGSSAVTLTVTDAVGTTVTVKLPESIAPVPPPPPPPGIAKIILGGWVQDNPTGTAAFVEAFGGVPASSACMVFQDSSSWANANSANDGYASRVPTLGQWPGIKIWAEMLQPANTGSDWSWTTSGTHDAYYTAAAKACKAANVSIIRLGWEFQYLAPYGHVSATNFVAAWRHIWNLYNAVAPGYFEFIWNPNSGSSSTSSPISAYYPGAQYVGLVGIDTYEAGQGWNQFTGTSWDLNDVVLLAIANGHDIAIPEWSLTPKAESGWTGSGDDPSFVDNLFTWAASVVTAHNINVYLLAWGDGYPSTSGTWGLQCFPNAFAELKAQVALYRAQGLVA